MKRLTFLLILLATNYISFAQSNFYRFSVGGGAGATTAFADLDDQKLSLAAYGTLDYHFTPFLTLGVEVQKGQVAAGGYYTDYYRREFINSYLSTSLNFKLQLGEFLSRYDLSNAFLNTIKGGYLGVGFGFIKNDVEARRSYDGVTFPGEDKSTESIIPFNVGINFYIPNEWGYKRFAINLNLQCTLTTGEGLDGYGVKGVTSQHNDAYLFGSAGIKYHFGTLGLDRRR